MPKHLTPAVDESWLYRLPSKYRGFPAIEPDMETYRIQQRQPDGSVVTEFEFPARPESSPSSSWVRTNTNGACRETSSTGTGTGPLSLALTAPHGEPVPVGHLTLIDRIKEAAR